MLLAWEKLDGAWFALVSYCLEGDNHLEGDGVLAQQWLAADLVTRVGQ